MIDYRFLLPAEEEMIEAAIFYESASVNLGADFLNDVDRVIDLLRNHPLLGQPVDDDLRRAILHRFPFSIIYAVDSDTILIIAVAHQRRRPDYWRERLKR